MARHLGGRQRAIPESHFVERAVERLAAGRTGVAENGRRASATADRAGKQVAEAQGAIEVNRFHARRLIIRGDDMMRLSVGQLGQSGPPVRAIEREVEFTIRAADVQPEAEDRAGRDGRAGVRVVAVVLKAEQKACACRRVPGRADRERRRTRGQRGDRIRGEGGPPDREVVNRAVEWFAAAGADIADDRRRTAAAGDGTGEDHTPTQRAVNPDTLAARGAVVGRSDGMRGSILELRERGPARHAIERQVEFAIRAVDVQAEAQDRPGGHGRIGSSVVGVILEAQQDAVATVLLAEDFVVVAGAAAPRRADAREDGDAGAHGERVIHPRADIYAIGRGIVESRRAQPDEAGHAGRRANEGTIVPANRVPRRRRAAARLIEGPVGDERAQHRLLLAEDGRVARAVPAWANQRLDGNASGHGEIICHA